MTKRTLANVVSSLFGRSADAGFTDSGEYWRKRYASGGNSGAGSYNELADFKARFLNDFVAEKHITSVVEIGCGDGNQLKLATYPKYIGYDISSDAIERCQQIFSGNHTRAFRLLTANTSIEEAELCISLDVVYHLVEDDTFNQYMSQLFEHATLYVIVYSTDFDKAPDPSAPHVRHRKFSTWVAQNAPEWRQIDHRANAFPFNGDFNVSSDASFFVFGR